MATGTPNSRLYKDALVQFKKDTEEHYRDSSKKLKLLHDFLASRASPEEAQAAAGNLKTDTGKKWGSKKVGEAEVPAAWIDKIMGNIGNFVEVGNYAMKGAPESVGLAWFAVKLTLSAIQSNYELYNFFGAGLTDISEIMIIIPHYDRLYDEKTKAKTNWKPSPVVDQLFQDIIATYAAVLRFSFSIQRHITSGTLAKIRHGFRDFIGTSKEKFQAELSLIASLKQKILEESQAIFQDKSLHQMEDMKSIVSNIEGTVTEMRSFQGELREMHEAQTARWDVVLQMFEDIKAMTKPKTPWELACHDFEKNKDALKPLKATSNALGDAIDRRHPDTCQWIFENPKYTDWIQSSNSDLLCLSGQQGSGKSILLASVVEKLDTTNYDQFGLIYLSCGTTGSGAASREAPTAEQVCHTLLYQLYGLSRVDESNVKLLEDCNKVFKDPKANRRRTPTKNTKENRKEGELPDFADAFLALAECLKLRIVVALDKVHNLAQNHQQELATKLQAILAPEEAPAAGTSIKFLIGCRSNTKFFNQMSTTKGSMDGQTSSLDVGDDNEDDMAKTLSDELQDVPGLTEAERKEAAEAIITKAGRRFAYIYNIAIPFIREPFQRPISRRLKSLPENMNNVYNDALHKLGSNYVDLLRTALTMTLLAPEPPKVQEVMDVYQLRYNNRGLEVEAQARALNVERDEERFCPPSELEIAQLRDASGPFLRIDQQVGSDEYFVNLQDAARVREFCFHSAHEADTKSRDKGEICVRCKSDLQEAKTLTVSEKEAHLDMALLCLRATNNPIFQRRVTKYQDVPQYSLPQGTASTRTQTDNGVEGVEGAEGEILPAVKEPEADSEESEAGEANNTENSADPNQVDEETKIDEDSGYESDESRDDEDQGEVSVAPPSARKDDDSFEEYIVVREGRYESLFWTEHMRQAEELWSPEERKNEIRWASLMSELDHWVSYNPDFFYAWQKLPNIDNYPKYHTGLKPLHLAALYGLTSWAEHLLAKGADPNEKAGLPVAKTPLQVTAWHGNSIPMLKLLLEHGASPSVEDEQTFPAFHEWMMEDSGKEVIELFLHHGADPTVVDQINHYTVLHYFAAHGKDVEALDLLLQETPSGKKPDINYSENSSPLHLLLQRREVPKPLLQAFLDRGANINKDDSYSCRPLQLATLWGDLATLQVLCKDQVITELDDLDDDEDTALHQAAIGEHPKCLAFLADLGANVDLQNKAGLAAIHDSAKNGNKECIQVLLAHNAHLNVTDKRNRNVLFYACLSDSSETAELTLDTLLENKVSMKEINAKTKTKRTPLRQAAGRGFDAVVEKLIKAAQSENDFDSLAINEPDERKGMTPLHRAAWFGRKNCVRLLLAAGADSSVHDKNEKTPLILAYEQWALNSEQNAFEDIISQLIESGPVAAKLDPELVAICAVNGSTRLLKQLVAIGSDLNQPDRYGWTPSELARKFRRIETAEFLKQQAAWAGMLPSRWEDNRTTISEDGKTVDHTSGNRICVSANKPLPAGLDSFYFEVTMKELEDKDKQSYFRSVRYIPSVAIGFCTIGGQAIAFPGWPPRTNAPSARSWGYHADDGGFFTSNLLDLALESDANKFQGDNESGKPLINELTYCYGDTVGCGVDLNARTIWYTRNGTKLDSNFNDVEGRLFPLLGLSDELVLETNFTGPFIWKGDKAEQVEAAAETAEANGVNEQPR